MRKTTLLSLEFQIIERDDAFFLEKSGGKFLFRNSEMRGMGHGEGLINGAAEGGNNGEVSLFRLRIHGRGLLVTGSNKGDAKLKA